MNRPSATISLRISHELWEQVYSLFEAGLCNTFSDAARSLIEAGLWLHTHKNDIQDPKKSQKLVEEWNAKMNEKEIFDWTKQLTDSQKDAIRGALELEKEDRFNKFSSS